MLRVLLIDEHRMLLESLADTLLKLPNICSVDMASDPAAALRVIKAKQPDIVLMEAQFPSGNAFDVVQDIRIFCPDCTIVFLTGHDYDLYIQQAIAVHAAGYILKRDGIEVLINAISRIAEGGTFFSEPIQSRWAFENGRPRYRDPQNGSIAPLTEREHELFIYLARGADQKTAMAAMQINCETADKLVKSIMRKLGIHDRNELSAWSRFLQG